jgi:hypothetical protein
MNKRREKEGGNREILVLVKGGADGKNGQSEV